MPKAPAAIAPAKVSSSPAIEPPLPDTYEAAVAELEVLIARMEGGDMPLDSLLGGYRRGAALMEFCRAKLQAVEDQIKVLDEDVLKPWKAQ